MVTSLPNPPSPSFYILKYSNKYYILQKGRNYSLTLESPRTRKVLITIQKLIA